MNDDVIPGSFREAPNIPLREERPLDEPKAYFAEDLIAIYTAFQEQVYSPRSVLYPSSGFDGSPAKVFENVTFVDIEDGNEGCIEALQEEGLTAIKQDIREYSPQQPHDLLILLNPGIYTEWASQHVAPGGYILSNNYHGNATDMHKQPEQFSLWGVMDFAGEDGVGAGSVTVSRDLENLFHPVADEEELLRFRPDHHEFLRGVFRSLDLNMPNFNANRPFEEVWADYRAMMVEDMPSRRVADRYIFVKK